MMSTAEWQEIESVLEEAAALDPRALAAWVDAAPEDLRDFARAMLDASPDFGPWAAEAAVRIIGAAPRLSVPSMLGHYRIVRYLAAGGMGEVYEAEDPRLKRRVAIKVLHAGAIPRLEEEAQALARLRHPNICRIYDVGRAEGVEYFVMELLDGIPPEVALGETWGYLLEGRLGAVSG